MLINVDFFLLILFGDCLAPWILGLVSFHFGKPIVVSLGVTSLSCCLPQKLWRYFYWTFWLCLLFNFCSLLHPSSLIFKATDSFLWWISLWINLSIEFLTSVTLFFIGRSYFFPIFYLAMACSMSFEILVPQQWNTCPLNWEPRVLNTGPSVKVLVAQSCRRSSMQTSWTVACQAPLSMEFSRQEYWTGLPSPSPGDLPDLGMEPRSPSLQVDSLSSKPPEKPWTTREIPCFFPFKFYLASHFAQSQSGSKIKKFPCALVWVSSSWAVSPVVEQGGSRGPVSILCSEALP